MPRMISLQSEEPTTKPCFYEKRQAISKFISLSMITDANKPTYYGSNNILLNNAVNTLQKNNGSSEQM